jgi:hypothetical protein
MAYTTINKSTEHFNTLTWTGNGNATRSYTGVGFQPDLIWTKNRSASQNHMFTDSIRGINNVVQSSTTSATISNPSSGYLSSFDSDGFSVQAGSSSTANFNTNSENYVAWNWKAGGATPTKTYKVVVVGGKYRFRNSADSATFAEDHPTLDLQEGGTYTFDLSDSTLSSHPFKFSTTSNGTHGGGTEYTSGVATNLAPGNPGATAVLTLSASTPTLYYYCSSHSGMGGQINTNSTFGSSNFDGAVKSLVSANTTAGFSMVQVSNLNSNTFGHGLSGTPSMVWSKRTDDTANWRIYYTGITSGNSLFLNSTAASTSESSRIGSTDSTTVTAVGSGNGGNAGTGTQINYCFQNINGFSRVGIYKGNNNSDGAFVFTGFKPAFLMIKFTGSGQNWIIIDNKRPGYNVISDADSQNIRPNSNVAEVTSNGIDLLSNGFKCRSSDGDSNGYTTEYIYMAFAEAPLVGSNDIPCTAR